MAESAIEKPTEKPEEQALEEHFHGKPQVNPFSDVAVEKKIGDSPGETNEKPSASKLAVIPLIPEGQELVQDLSGIPAVDAEAIKILENKAVELEGNLHRMMDNLTRSMNGISSISVQYAECYKESVRNVGNATDSSTKAMANLIGKCEEMNKCMEPLYNMSEQVKTLSSLLEQFEEKCK